MGFVVVGSSEQIQTHCFWFIVTPDPWQCDGGHLIPVCCGRSCTSLDKHGQKAFLPPTVTASTYTHREVNKNYSCPLQQNMASSCSLRDNSGNSSYHHKGVSKCLQILKNAFYNWTAPLILPNRKLPSVNSGDVKRLAKNPTNLENASRKGL